MLHFNYEFLKIGLPRTPDMSIADPQRAADHRLRTTDIGHNIIEFIYN